MKKPRTLPQLFQAAEKELAQARRNVAQAQELILESLVHLVRTK